jgi:hypothetical protein
MAVAATLEEAMLDWQWLFPVAHIEILTTSCIGDVIFADAQGTMKILDVGVGEVREYDAEEERLLAGQQRLIGKMEAAGLKLGAGQCYGFKPYAIFGKYEPENLYIAALPEYVSFMGYFHSQIKDLPDGTKIRFKVGTPRNIP